MENVGVSRGKDRWRSGLDVGNDFRPDGIDHEVVAANNVTRTAIRKTNKFNSELQLMCEIETPKILLIKKIHKNYAFNAKMNAFCWFATGHVTSFGLQLLKGIFEKFSP